MAELTDRLWRWVRLRSRRAWLVVGVVDGDEAHAFVEQLRRGDVMPIPFDATRPADADVIVIVGRIASRAAAHVAALRAQAPGAVFIAFDDPRTATTYATWPAADVVDIDVVVHGVPPSAAALTQLTEAILAPRAEPA
ncbi:MAG TPA: hypothetical protein VGF99_07635 [Myxococcota bacterium]